MQYITDLKGCQFEVAEVAASLIEVKTLLTDVELIMAMNADEVKYWQDIYGKLLKLQSELV